MSAACGVGTPLHLRRPASRVVSFLGDATRPAASSPACRCIPTTSSGCNPTFSDTGHDRGLRQGSVEVPVPTISVFYGIVIAMFFNDHDPPHFHARYAESHSMAQGLQPLKPIEPLP